MDRKVDYSLPAAWRGVASPRYLRMARWLSLAEDLGGARSLGPMGPGAAESVVTARGYQAGTLDMSLTILSQETEQTDELREFLATELKRHERLILMLFYADGLSFEEVAEVLDLPEATVAEVFERTLATIQQRFGLLGAE